MNKLFTTAGIEEQIRLRLLKMVDEADGELTQREMARCMGISLGKTNYCLLELVKKGLVKADAFVKNPNCHPERSEGSLRKTKCIIIANA
jgi:hypothetical protein